MEQKKLENVDIERCKELFAYEMTQVILNLKGEFAAVSGKDTRYAQASVEQELLTVPTPQMKPVELPRTELTTPRIPQAVQVKVPEAAAVTCQLKLPPLEPVQAAAIAPVELKPIGVEVPAAAPVQVAPMAPVELKPVQVEVPAVAPVQVAPIAPVERNPVQVEVPAATAVQVAPMAPVELKPVRVEVPAVAPVQVAPMAPVELTPVRVEVPAAEPVQVAPIAPVERKSAQVQVPRIPKTGAWTAPEMPEAAKVAAPDVHIRAFAPVSIPDIQIQKPTVAVPRTEKPAIPAIPAQPKFDLLAELARIPVPEKPDTGAFARDILGV